LARSKKEHNSNGYDNGNATATTGWVGNGNDHRRSTHLRNRSSAHIRRSHRHSTHLRNRSSAHNSQSHSMRPRNRSLARSKMGHSNGYGS
jgi:hypothetical protein